MAIINSSYEVLSNPDKRHEHDRWISQQEAQASESTSGNETVPPKTAQHGQSTHQSLPEAATGTIRGHISENWPRYILLGVFFWGIWALDKSGTPPPGPKPYTQTAIPVPSVPEYIRPLTAPNGELWPTSAAYVKGYPRIKTNGLSIITIDNSRNDADVFVKLVSLDDAQAYPVRQFYIPAFGSFTLTNVTAGKYDIRYRDLSNGGLSRTEEFILEEIDVGNATQYSDLTMTLYKVVNGDMQTYGLSEEEF